MDGQEDLSERTIIVRWMWVLCVKAPDRFEVQKPQISEAFPPAVIREAADE